jgi:hypothetical protein
MGLDKGSGRMGSLKTIRYPYGGHNPFLMRTEHVKETAEADLLLGSAPPKCITVGIPNPEVKMENGLRLAWHC